MDVFGLLGSPVSHSLSPPMHEAAYEARDLAARYVTFEPDPGELEAAIAGADALGVSGLNVTAPFKRDVLAHVAPDDRAARIGAVNTIDVAADPRTGHNTDAAGAVRALREAGVALDGATAVVVGAGGAGRAVAVGLADAGAAVAVANRTASRAREVAEIVGGEGRGLGAVPDLVDGADVLVNATTVGMGEDASPVPADALHADLAVLDAVYRPLETRLLCEADARGARTVDGARMLLYQGARAFELWTGEPAPLDAMERALRSRL